MSRSEDLWTEGLICAFEHSNLGSPDRWVAIGWKRVSELVQIKKDLISQQFDDSEANIWWCHVDGSHESIQAWLKHPQWLEPNIGVALADQSQRHPMDEVQVINVAGGLLFELRGQSVDGQVHDEDHIPMVLRFWQAKNFLITCLHVKGPEPRRNILRITEIQDLSRGGDISPRTIHEVIAALASRLTHEDDRLFRKSIFGVVDDIELKFMDRKKDEDMQVFGEILDEEIKKLSKQVIRVKWSLRARRYVIFELFKHLKGKTTRLLLEQIRDSTREMLQEQEAIRGRLFTIEDVMLDTIGTWMQDRSVRAMHKLMVFGSCGLGLLILIGLFRVNLDSSS